MAACLPPMEVYVVNGFWRSGTTWLQQNLARAIGAKTVFEPFDRTFPAYRCLAREFHRFRTRSDEEGFFPYLDNRENFARVRPYLDAAVRGYVGGAFALTARDTWRDAFRRKVVVKFVNASLSLTAIHAEYGVPVVHIRRHPCAIVASLRSAKDWGWNFDDVSIRDILLAPADGRAEIFDAHRDVIARYDREGSAAKIATYWALTERYAEETLADVSWARIVRYEDLIADPAGGFGKIIEFLGCGNWTVPHFEVDSAVTEKSRQNMTVQQRTSDWRTRLSVAEIEAVMTVVGELFPGFEDA